MQINDLVLLCGFSRSGTTWLSKILDSIPSTMIVSEPDKRINKNLLFGKVNHCIEGFNDSDIELYQKSIKEVSEAVFCNLQSFPYFRKEYCVAPYSLYLTISFIYKYIAYLLEKMNSNISLKIPNIFFDQESNCDLIWKSVNQSSNIPFLQEAFPNLKIIYILRNPFSTLASLLVNNTMKLDGKDFRRIKERKGSLFFKMNTICLKEIEKWEELKKKTLLWRISCESAYLAGKNNKNFYLVIYEDLVKNPFEVTSNMLEWLGWPFHNDTKKFISQSTGQIEPPLINRIFSSGYFGVYRKPGINFAEWKKVLNKKDYDLIFSVLEGSPLLKFWSNDILSF